ncbi:MAG: type II secretion system protein [Luteolibacter sp.]
MKHVETHTGRPHPRCRTGFTLVELLVSVTIIITLAALVFAVTGKIRASAQQSNLMSALRQVGIANAAYAAENNGAINTVRDEGERGPWEGPGVKYATNSFIGRMTPYLFANIESTNEKEFSTQVKSSLAALLGTTDLKTMKGTPFDGVPVTTDGSGIRNPFAVNRNVRPVWGVKSPRLTLSQFGDLSNVLYLTYGRYQFGASEISKYTPLPKAGDSGWFVFYLPNRKGIFTFLDGHVELLTPPISERLLSNRPGE